MKKLLLMTCAVAAYAAHATPPEIGNVQFKQDENRLVTISYTLGGADAIVMMDVLTNGVSIGRALYSDATGDVNVKVKQGARQILWQPRTTWPDQKIRDKSLSVKLTAWALDNPPDYMCVDLVTKSNVVWYLNADDVPGGVTADIYKTDKLLMRRIHAEGIRWLMGLPKAGGTGDNWEPGHFVTLTNDYYMAIFEMTIGQRSRIVSGTTASNGDYPDRSTSYEGLRGATSGHDWPSDGHKVSGDSVLGKLRSHAGINGFDLPTQAEWEYAARAGNLGYCYYHWGFDTSQAAFEPYEWTSATVPSSAAQKVGLLKPNAWGLYDMHGNCFERCLDWYAAGDTYSKHGSDVIAPPGPTMGTARVIHGGGYTHASGPAYIFYREGYSPDASNDTNIGYRLACCADFRDVQ